MHTDQLDDAWVLSAKFEDLVPKLYRTDVACSLKGHPRHPCANPRCLKGLRLISPDEFVRQKLGPDPRHRRVGDLPVGLQNLGSTCYMNALLQILFHNRTFRQSAFLAPAHHELTVELRNLFAEMQEGVQAHVVPTQLAQVIQLERSEQEDVHEFFKLLLQTLEANQEEMKLCIQQQFTGKAAYETTCNGCGNKSLRGESFIDLDLFIKGKPTIEECLDDLFLAEQNLTGDDKYACDRCASRQEGTRRYLLKDPPENLILHVMRFMFDPNRGHRQKLQDSISYPLTLDIAKYHGGNRGPAPYDLVGVIFHKGRSCYHGHYVSHFLNEGDNNWYVGDDDHVEEVNCYQEAERQAHPEDPERGRMGSTEAYMLVYRRRCAGRTERPAIPEDLQLHVEKGNKAHKERVMEYSSRVDQLRKLYADWKRSTTETGRLDLYVDEPAKEPFHFISWPWLAAWAAGKFIDPTDTAINANLSLDGLVQFPGTSRTYTTEPGPESEGETAAPSATASLGEPAPPSVAVPVDDGPACEVKLTRSIPNKLLLCAHGSVNYSRPHEYKIISGSSWKRLQKVYGGENLTKDNVCKSCVSQRVERAKNKQQQAELRSQLIERFNTVKQQELQEKSEGFWVSTEFMMEWRRKASPHLARTDLVAGLLCQHGALSPFTYKTLVPADLWEYLKSNYNASTELPAQRETCRQCASDTLTQVRRQTELTHEKGRLKKLLAELLNWTADENDKVLRMDLVQHRDRCQKEHRQLMTQWHTKCKELKKNWQEEVKKIRAEAAANPEPAAPEPSVAPQPVPEPTPPKKGKKKGKESEAPPAEPPASECPTTEEAPKKTGPQLPPPPTLPPEPAYHPYYKKHYFVPVDWVTQCKAFILDFQHQTPRPGPPDLSSMLCGCETPGLVYSPVEFIKPTGKQAKQCKMPPPPPFALLGDTTWKHLVESFGNSEEDLLPCIVHDDITASQQPATCEKCASEKRRLDSLARSQFENGELLITGKFAVTKKKQVPIELRVTASWHDTLTTVKLRIVQSLDFVVHPEEMLLNYNGEPLLDDAAVLQSYGIEAGAVLTLVRSDTPAAPCPEPPKRAEKGGFRGSALLGNAPMDTGNQWGCPMCTFLNEPAHLCCAICGTQRPLSN